jgi:hypothetical protein
MLNGAKEILTEKTKLPEYQSNRHKNKKRYFLG